MGATTDDEMEKAVTIKSTLGVGEDNTNNRTPRSVRNHASYKYYNRSINKIIKS